MWPKLIFPMIVMALILSWPGAALADQSGCVRKDRKVTLLEQPFTAIEKRVEVVKGYDCNGLRIEFLRLSEVALALLESRKSRKLDAALGKARVVETPPLQNYRNFLARFGKLYPAASLVEEMPYLDKKYEPIAEMKLLFEPPIKRHFLIASAHFPAIEEFLFLSKGTWPESLKLFATDGYEDSGSPATSRSAPFPPTLWRSLRIQDLLSFNENARRVSEMFGQYADAYTTASENRMNEFEFLIAASAGNLPDELIRMQGWHVKLEDGCYLAFVPTEMSSSSPKHFSFMYKMPELYFDAMLVRNVSKQAIAVTGFSGSKQTGTGLRRIDQQGAVSTDVDDLASRVAIAPSEAVIFPTAVLLRPQELDPCCNYVPAKEKRAADAIDQFARAGYDVSQERYQLPSYPLYIQLLPTYSIAGLASSRGKLSFERTRPLRLSFATSLEEGSCPYLLTKRGAGKSDLWTDHGKILHAAQSRRLKGVHSETLRGAPRMVRIEEREPEVAVIDMAKLTVTFEDGTTAVFYPDLARLRAVDGDEQRLRWGEALEFGFPARDSLDRRSAKHSELEIVGYYERLDFASPNRDRASSRRQASHQATAGQIVMSSYVADPKPQRCHPMRDQNKAAPAFGLATR